MSEAEHQGLFVWASYELVGAIGLDKENTFNPDLEVQAINAYALLTSKYKKKYEKDVELERKELVKTNHIECKHCNAVIWQPDMCDNYCSSCGN